MNRLVTASAMALIASLSAANAQTEIQWWHAMTGANNDVVTKLAEDFNASQKDYKVVVSYKGSYPDTLNAGIAAFRAGNAPHILQVFEVKRLGKIAGCRVTEGVVRRGAGVRLLRDGVVIHTGELATLRRFKDDVREVQNGYECGMSFANYDDIRVDDQIECYETETVAAA